MVNLKFVDTHNMVAFLSKPEESDEFEQIVDFLNAHLIKYALTINPTIYTSCIEQFWSTIKAKTINGEVQLRALVDGKKLIVTEASIRRDLQLEDEDGVDCLLNSTIFEQLALMGGNTLQSGQDSLKLNELMELCTNLQTRVLDLEKIKTTQRVKIDSLKRRVKKLEKKRSSRTQKLKRLYKVDLSDRVESSDDEQSFVAAKDVNLTINEVTLAQALAALKSPKSKVKGDVIEEPSVPVSTANASTKVIATTNNCYNSNSKERNCYY
ncbi:hypothetical protein Tco_1514302 [Tanacetum coccineum]